MGSIELFYSIVYVSGEDEEERGAELRRKDGDRFINGIGWISSKYCHFPQEIVLKFTHRCNVEKIQILCHHLYIPKRLEFYVGNVGIADRPSLSKAKFDRLGYISFQDNASTNYKARELKSIYVDASGWFLKLKIFENYVNEFNRFNQVGIMAITVYGYPLDSDLYSKCMRYYIRQTGEDSDGSIGLDAGTNGPPVRHRRRRSSGTAVPISAATSRPASSLAGSRPASRASVPNLQRNLQRQSGRTRTGRSSIRTAAEYEAATGKINYAEQMKKIALIYEGKQRAAVEDEQYQEANRLKKAKEQLRGAADECEPMYRERRKAAQDEDYDKAARLNDEIIARKDRAFEKAEVHLLLSEEEKRYVGLEPARPEAQVPPPPPQRAIADSPPLRPPPPNREIPRDDSSPPPPIRAQELEPERPIVLARPPSESKLPETRRSPPQFSPGPPADGRRSAGEAGAAMARVSPPAAAEPAISESRQSLFPRLESRNSPTIANIDSRPAESRRNSDESAVLENRASELPRILTGLPGSRSTPVAPAAVLRSPPSPPPPPLPPAQRPILSFRRTSSTKQPPTPPAIQPTTPPRRVHALNRDDEPLEPPSNFIMPTRQNRDDRPLPMPREIPKRGNKKDFPLEAVNIDNELLNHTLKGSKDDKQPSGQATVELEGKEAQEYGYAQHIFGSKIVVPILSKSWEHRQKGFKDLEAVLRQTPPAKKPIDGINLLTAACQLIRKGLQDKVFSVFQAAQSSLRYLVNDFLTKHKVPKGGTFVAEQTCGALLNRTGDTIADPRFKPTAQDCLVSTTSVPTDLTVKKAFTSHILMPFQASGHAKIDTGHAETAERLIREHGMKGEIGISLEKCTQFATSCLLHTSGEVRDVGMKILTQLYKSNDKQAVRNLLPKDTPRMRQKSLIYRQLFEAFDEMDKRDGIKNGVISQEDAEATRNEALERLRKENEELKAQIVQRQGAGSVQSGIAKPKSATSSIAPRAGPGKPILKKPGTTKTATARFSSSAKKE